MKSSVKLCYRFMNGVPFSLEGNERGAFSIKNGIKGQSLPV